MKKENILNYIKIGSLAVIISVGLSYALAWTGPTLPPPEGNVAAPINASASSQNKTGKLGLGYTGVGTDVADFVNYVLDVKGATKTVGLTATGNTYLNGDVVIASGLPSSGKVLVSDDTGKVAWKTLTVQSDYANVACSADLNGSFLMSGNGGASIYFRCAGGVLISTGLNGIGLDPNPDPSGMPLCQTGQSTTIVDAYDRAFTLWCGSNTIGTSGGQNLSTLRRICMRNGTGGDNCTKPPSFGSNKVYCNLNGNSPFDPDGDNNNGTFTCSNNQLIGFSAQGNSAAQPVPVFVVTPQ